MKLTKESLLNFLNGKNYEAKIQVETDQIFFSIKKAENEFPVFLRIYPKGDLLQLLAFMPFQIKEEVEADLARLLHLINKELDMPGMGMDEIERVAFYRCMIPVSDKEVDESILESYLQSMEQVCETMAPAVLTIGKGLMTYSDLLQKAKELERNTRINP